MADFVSYNTTENEGEPHPEFVADEPRPVVVIRASKTRRDRKTEAFPLGGFWTPAALQVPSGLC